MELPQIIAHLGFSEKESAVYLASLELGMAPISVIAKRAKLKRPTTYEILKKLSQKGVADFFVKKKTRYYSVVSPKALLEKQKSHIQQFEEVLPEMMAIQNQIVNKPRISFYEGEEDIRRLYLDVLTSKVEVLNYFLPEKSFEYLGEEWLRTKFIPVRIQKKISLRAIMPDSPMAGEFLQASSSELRKAKIAPKNSVKITNEIFIYDNKMSIFSFDEDLSLLIESTDIVTTQKGIFELAWTSSLLIS